MAITFGRLEEAVFVLTFRSIVILYQNS